MAFCTTFALPLRRLECNNICLRTTFVDGYTNSSNVRKSASIVAMSASDGLLGDVYQRIWTADHSMGSGVKAVLQSDQKNEAEGYVIVNEADSRSMPGELFPGEPVIPESKSRSYALGRALFDNYTYLASVREEVDPEELVEIDALLEYVVTTPCMQIAREYLSESAGRSYTDRAWFARLRELWFRPFRIGSSPSRSGFEHVFLGERKDGNVGGLHWWYYYAAKESEFTYRGANYGNVEQGTTIPEVVTASFSWDVDNTTVYKRRGGFFVGPSVEGLMALGTVRAHESTPRRAVIEGVEFDLRCFLSPDGRSVNTFFPVLRRIRTSSPSTERPSDSPAPVPVPPITRPTESIGTVRLVGAFTNPSGPDAGRESVTLMNMSGPKVANLSGWTLVGPRGGEVVFGEVLLAPGAAETITLSARGGVALSNKGGSISLRAPNGQVVQTVDYASVIRQGEGVLWDGGSRLIPVSATTSIRS